ncbi:unnamed protein product, partial [marine sediment metagenome]
MLNRNAEALFWIGRYIERAENHARLIDVHYHIQQEEDFQAEGHKWSRLIDALGVRNEYLQQFESFAEQDVLSFITLDLGNSNSLFSCVHQARNNLRTLRQHLPSELWDIANGFNLWLGEQSVADIMSSPHQFYQQVKERTAMFLGAEQSVMLYQLLKLRLEIAHLHLQLAVRLHQREYVIIKEPAGCFQTLVKIKRSHEGFEHIGQQGRAGSS